MKKRIIALLLSLVMLTSLLTPTALATEGEEPGTAQEEVKTPDQGGRVVEVPAEAQAGQEVTVEAPEEGESYQWQFQLTEDLWVSISGDEGQTIALTYAKICNMLDENGEARLRCLVDGQAGEPFTVVLTESQDVSQDETLDEIPDEIPDEISAEEDPVPEEDPVLADASEVAIHAVKSAAIGAAALTENEEEPLSHVITIEYIYRDNPAEHPAPDYTFDVAHGGSQKLTVPNPEVQGYDAETEEANLPGDVTFDREGNCIVFNLENVTQNYTILVEYIPGEVTYTVYHYFQNITGDSLEDYTREEEVCTGTTKETVGDVAKKQDGFEVLSYEHPVIAADGTTVVEIYYNRLYFLATLDLDGGYGAEPVYARYGSPLAAKVTSPTKPGYNFAGWKPEMDAAMPAENRTYKARWTQGDTKYRVQYWQENADDDGYSFKESVTKTAKSGDSVSGTNDKSYPGFRYNAEKTDKDVKIKGDGSSVVNVYYQREIYTVSFWSYSSRRIPSKEYVNLRITAKYGANIRKQWPTYSGSNSWAVSDNDGGPYQCNIDVMPLNGAKFYGPHTGSGSETAYYYVSVLPGETGSENYKGKQYKLDHSDTSPGSGYTVTDEDKYSITGFDFVGFTAERGGDWWNGYYDKYDGAKFYYDRKNFDLVFDDNFGTTVRESLPYQQKLSESKNYKANYQPAYPSEDKLEPGAYYFDGWFSDPACEVPVDWSRTMPADNVVVYAKWAPKEHTVKLYPSEADSEAATNQIGSDLKVPHNQKADKPNDPTDESGMLFVGWFYRENGEEKAFDFSMAVTKDLTLYAKWSSNTMLDYTVYYVLVDSDGNPVRDENGQQIQVAAPTTGQIRATTTRTFAAKVGNELYSDYQEGYFPKTRSTSITAQLGEENTATIEYVQVEALSYTVRYVEKETGNVLHEAKVVANNRKSVVVEPYLFISGYQPDAYQKTLKLSLDSENEIIFYYAKDELHGAYKISYWVQDLEREDEYTELTNRTFTGIGDVSTTQSGDTSVTINGFTYDHGMVKTTGEFVSGSEGVLSSEYLLEIRLYYNRNSYPYEVRYLEETTNNVLHEPKTGSAKYNARVTETAENIPGYIPKTKQDSCIIAVQPEGENVAKVNVITFYYTEQEVTINYVAVGPKGCGSVTPTSETVKVVTGEAQGSTAAANDGFRFVGWYDNANCTGTALSTELKYVPTKEEGTLWPESSTYYAKFEYDVANLTIRKTGCAAIDENQSFIFTVTGGDLPDEGLKVVVKGNGSVTIKGLKVGEYTVTEESGWSWRYKVTNNGGSDSKNVDVTVTNGSKANTVLFENYRKEPKWLNGCSIEVNNWKRKSDEESSKTN